ncbi:MAG: hypothetical protein K2U26_11045, partial [Cyclobacteriaceae bacterium]|nr:hypothetical protein [Cyclobacteriaceae bacterium]
RAQAANIKKFYWPALLLKSAAGLAVGALYFFHYSLGDTLSYWQDGMVLADVIRHDPVRAVQFYLGHETDTELLQTLTHTTSRSLFFDKIAGLLAVVSAGNYWVMSIMCSFISFFGSWFLFTKVVEAFPLARWAAAIAFLFWPSVVLWSSGLIKESLGLAGLYFLSGVLVSQLTGTQLKFWQWSLIVLSAWVTWELKYYWLGIFAPVALATIIIIKLKPMIAKLARFELLAWSGLLLILFIIGMSAHPNFYPHRFAEVIVQNNKEFTSLSGNDKLIVYSNLQPTVASLFINVPSALVAGLFRPFVWETFNLLSVLASLENLAFAVLLLSSLVSLPLFFSSPHRLMALAIVFYSCSLAVFLALSTPNFGSLSRYKIGFLPFLVFLVLYKSPLLGWIERNQK